MAWILVAGAAVFLGCGPVERDAEVRAVVLVDVDTLRADALSVYGCLRPTSPSIDTFARSAARFEWAFSQAPYTLPSQVSILTSTYPWSHGVLDNDDRLGGEAFTLAEAFSAAGWETAAFVDGGFLKAEFGFDQGFDHFVDLDGGGLRRGEPLVAGWIERRSDRPFFLFVHTYDVHSPYAPPEPFRTRFLENVPAPSPGFEPTSEILERIRASHWGDQPIRLEPDDIAYARALYEAEVAFVDAWFGRLLAQLRAAEILDHAVIALVSDHGEEFQEHGSVLHEKVFATVTRVPLVISAPDGRPGIVIRNVVETVDLMPTLLDLAGLARADGLQGRSLANSVRLGLEPPERSGISFSPHYGGQRAVTGPELRVILTVDSARTEAFLYRQDPLEQRDIAVEAAVPVGELTRDLRRRLVEAPRRPELRSTGALTPEAEASLRALGYLN